MKIEISDETADHIVALSLNESYNILKKNTEDLKKIKNKEDYISENIKENEKFLKSITSVFEYYTGEKLK